MRTATLDDFMALNDQLAALLQAGVPVEVGLGQGGRDPTATLQQINASVARRVSQGTSLSDALNNDDAVPSAYRGLIQVGLQSGNLADALSGHCRLAQSVEGTRHAVWQGLLYPLIVCCLAYAGLIALCMLFVPVLEDLYLTLQMQPGLGLSVLQGLRDTLPVWVAVPPAILLIALIWALSVRSSQSTASMPTTSAPSWLPGMSQAIYWQRCANFADGLATLLENDLPVEQGMALAAGAAGDVSLSRGVAEVLAARNVGQVLADDSLAARRFPPFLRWALLHSAETTGMSRALRMAAAWYRDKSQRRAERIRIATPLLACVVLGGSATLLYGLALFMPVVEMLRQLAD